MPATTFSSPLRPDKTMSIAFAAVALLGFFEVAAVGIHFIGKFRAEHKSSQPAVATEPNIVPTAAPIVPQPAGAQPATAPATQSTPSNAALSMAEHLLQEATQLRERGDTTN